MSNFISIPIPNSPVHSISIQPDGSVLIGGSFTQVRQEGVNYNKQSICRIIMDYTTESGVVDNSFNYSGSGIPGSKISQQVDTIISTNDRIFIGGNFASYNGKNVNCLARLYNGIGYFPLVKFMGKTYDKLFVGSNSYLTFGHGSSVFDGLGSSNPAYPGIFINAGDRSYQRVSTEITNNTLTIRYQGGVNTGLNMSNEPEIHWSVTFYIDSDNIDINVYTISSVDGFTAIKDSTSIIKSFVPVTSNRYRLSDGYAVKNEKVTMVKFESDADVSGYITSVSTSKTIAYGNAVGYFQNKANSTSNKLHTGETFLPGMMYLFKNTSNNIPVKATFLYNTLKYYFTINFNGSYGYGGDWYIYVSEMFVPVGFYVESITYDCNNLAGSGSLYTTIDAIGQITSVELSNFNNNVFSQSIYYGNLSIQKVNTSSNITMNLNGYYASGYVSVEIILKNISY